MTTIEGSAAACIGPELCGAAAQLPYAVIPVIQKLAENTPEAIMACDRNGRPLGRAIEYVCEAAGIDIPSQSRKVWYKKISNKNVSMDASVRHFADFAEEVGQDSSPRIVVVDDHMSRGGTKYLFSALCRLYGLRAEVTWITLTGSGSDMRLPNVPFSRAWSDRPDILGIDYTPDLQPREVETEQSQAFYATMRSAAATAARLLTHS